MPVCLYRALCSEIVSRHVDLFRVKNVSVPLRILISPEYTESDLERNRTLEPPNGAFEYGTNTESDRALTLSYYWTCELLLKCSELVIYVPSSLKFRVGLNVLPDALS